MERNNVLGMICGYYLSRFDAAAYARFGHTSQQATHEAMATALNVPATSIKNWRDEFDPVHENTRQGWHRRPMAPSRKRALEALGHLEEPELFRLVMACLESPTGEQADALSDALDSASAEERADDTYGLRGPTGAKAEAAFVTHHAQTGEPISGDLRDRTHDSCGFDFEIVNDSGSFAVEVKGLAGVDGGVTFTEKEWSTAQAMGDRYYLAIVRDVASTPRVSLIKNPAACLDPRMRAYTTVQIGWSRTSRSRRLSVTLSNREHG